MQLLIKEVVPQKSVKSGKFYQKVTCGDGVTYSAWDDDFTPYLNHMADVEIKEQGNYKNIKLVKESTSPAPASSAAPTTTHHAASSASDFDIRKTSALCALEVFDKNGEKLTLGGLKINILWFENYFRTGSLGATEDKGQD